MRTRTVCAALAVGLATVLAASPAEPAVSRFAGTYTTTRPGADSTQALTLVLERGGRATLTTGFPDLERRYGHDILPVREAGTWRGRGQTAEVRFATVGLMRNGRLTRTRKDAKVLGFALRGCRLIAVQYSKLLYGEAGLAFDKSGCKR